MPDNRPHLIEKINLNAPSDTLRRTLIAGTDTLLKLRVTRGPVPENTTGATIALLLSGDDGGTPWGQTCAGAAEDAESGWWSIPLPAAKLNLVGNIDGQILLTDSEGSVVGWQLLSLKVVAKLPGGASPAPGAPIDWSYFTAHLNAATHGPHKEGDGIAFGTPDATGRVPLNVQIPGQGVRIYNSDRDIYQRLRLRGDAGAEYMEIIDEI